MRLDCPSGKECFRICPDRNRGAYLIQKMNDKLVEHKQYIHEYGIDMPEIRDWKWNA